MTRLPLPNRRGHLTVDFEHKDHRYTAGIGFAENGRLAEIFLNFAKTGTDAEVSARDAAIAASLLLQHGCPVSTLRKALTREPNGAPSGPLAAALDILAREGIGAGDGDADV